MSDLTGINDNKEEFENKNDEKTNESEAPKSDDSEKVDNIVKEAAKAPTDSNDSKEEAKIVTKTETTITTSKQANDIVYCVKWIDFNNKHLPIVLQNENGPCPLIAIANILFLKQIINLDSKIELVTSKNLIDHLGDALLRFKLSSCKIEDELNFNQNFSDALNSLHSLEFGLDVNIKFTGVSHFEYTRELNIFDMFNINLYHGWLVDPQQVEIASIIQNLSYNQLVDRIIYLKNSDSQIDVAKGMQVEEFLDATQSQLTFHGLVELQEALKPNELAVFFRNNHFSTILKHNVSFLFTFLFLMIKIFYRMGFIYLLLIKGFCIALKLSGKLYQT